jgi:5,5'-dehydrodivanillate O-demethylase
VPCNWFQCHENTIDPVHFEWLHDTWSQILRGRTDAGAPTHLRLNFVEFEHGFQYQRIREGQSEEDELWTVGRVSLWPHGFYLGSHFEWRIPVDDDNCLSICWFYQHVPTEREPFHQNKIPYWYAPLKDEQTGRWITSHVVNQDFVGWVGQGTVADRTKEHLGESDRGIILLRRRMLEEARKVQQGQDPKGLIYDPAQNECIVLPTIDLQGARNGRPMAEFVKAQRRFLQPGRRLGELPWFAHQPEDVRLAWVRAMGLEDVERQVGDGRAEAVAQRT